MAKKPDVIQFFSERLDRLEKKVDDVTITAMPDLLTKVAVLIANDKKETQFKNRIYAGIMLVMSLCSLGVAALAYFKN